jgi:shikimate dehydrogenase
MATRQDIAALQSCIANRLDESVIGVKAIAGIIGDGPSHYSKSPALWNAAFRHLGMNAIYLPFDVAEDRVGDLIHALRDSQRFMGVNVTVPHKVRVINFVDELDPGAARIGAVNTIVKSAEGKLIGYNTDGEGFVDSVLGPPPGGASAFMDTLNGVDVLLLGAGGSAHAVAFHVSDHIGQGKLIIANRTVEQARALAEEICKTGHEAIAINESEISARAPKVGLIINCTTKGQGGIRQLADGTATILEPYSSLAPASPPSLVDLNDPHFEAKWRTSASADIEANNQVSELLAKKIPPDTRFYDLIYHPKETVFLRHGRLTGHQTMNGKYMIVCQAVIAFCKRICQRQLQELGRFNDQTFAEIASVMHQAW